MPRDSIGKRGRNIRHARVRKKISGTGERPRLCVFRSLNHVYAQVIDDERGVTLAAAGSLDQDIRGQKNGKSKIEVSTLVGSLLASRAKENGVTSVVFDRGGYKYHGRVRALADAAREGGLQF